MVELRWNPLLRTYTMMASNRQARPNLPKDQCPFCVGSDKIKEEYDVISYPNDFPVLSFTPNEVEDEFSDFFKAEKSYGKCEVILYSPDHYSSMAHFDKEKIYRIIALWTARFAELSKDRQIKYIFEFENKGEEVGVTMPHPHGQLYAYPFVPLKIRTELDSCKAYYEEKKENLFEVMNREELKSGKRIVFENNTFVSYIPYFTDYPYGVFIVCKNQKNNFTEFEENEKQDLAEQLQKITQAFDKVFNKPFPYMMCIHQNPLHSPEYADATMYYRFHIEFYPPLRAENRIKWNASSETGAWAAANPLSVEECAEKLRSLVG